MTVTVDYTARINWGTQNTNNSNRPFVMVTIHGLRNSKISEYCLMDTGADYLMLDSALLTPLGLSLNGCMKAQVNFADGRTVRYPICTVDISIFGETMSVDALFGTVGTPILGRTAIQRMMEFGIDLQGWLYCMRDPMTSTSSP